MSKELTNGDTFEVWHDWTDDGKWLVYDGHIKLDNDKENYDIYLKNSETLEIKRLTTDTLFQQGPVFVLAD